MPTANRLADETSLYLRQHAQNPVDWYPWGEEALARARDLDRPLFVSIGYSACHWCHVMAHESFEDEGVAAYLNGHFVSVKVDREERPDVDAIYMEAVQALNDGHGGWPLTVFATADGRPFFGGTYFPPEPRHGAPAFIEVATAVAGAWTTRRAELDAQAAELTAAVASRLDAPAASRDRPAAARLVDEAVERVAQIADREHGGIGRAPKFPQAPILELLMRAGDLGHPEALALATAALDAMAAGGIYDHLGGGFARYSTDRAWLVPHFEKMLYDQAQLARAYCHAWQLTGRDDYRQVLDETIAYVLRELRDPGGGIRSAQDADSDGEEGRFYTWTTAELADALGERDGEAAARYYGVTDAGNFERGRSVLHRPPGQPLARQQDVETLRARLFAARAERTPPAVDDKVLAEWNAMACATLAEAASATGTAAWLDAAVEIGDFLIASLRRSDGRWMRAWAAGRATTLAVAADYAWLVECFTRLGEATGDARWTAEALLAADGLVELFAAPDGGWYTTGADAEQLVVRPRDTYDSVTPAAGSIAASALARLGALTGSAELLERAAASVASAGEALVRSPLAFPHLVTAALLCDDGLVEVVVGRGAHRRLVDAVHRAYLPDVVLAWGDPAPGPLWEGRDGAGEERAFVCRSGACLAPVGDPAALLGAVALARDAAR
ncbi:MAG TPA: thioredoxin domain-containing protein [Acidimicrobiales bacterium]|nr:thioredoxin domain-containing protein [Acidimicrobiales bacterium]